MEIINQPYVKQYHANGVVSNPITQQRPYLHNSSSTRQKRRGNHRVAFDPISNGFVTERKTATGKWTRF